MSFELILLSALTAGLFGSLHCVGMCGGIASALGVSLKQSNSLTKPASSSLFFQLGRISSYGVAGFLAGTFGDVLTQTDMLKDIGIYLRLMSAIFIVGLGLYLAGLSPFFSIIEKMGVPIWKKISPLSKHLLPVKYLPQAYGLGFLWGWLPCGLTYSMLLWSIAAGGAIEGGLLMIAFGLGTIPAMLSMTLGAGGVMKLVQKPVLRKLAGLLIVIAGLYILQHAVMMLNPEHNHSVKQNEQEAESQNKDHQKMDHSQH